MSSILTNTAALSALQILSGTQRNLSQTQAQISSGLKVARAADNAAYWSIGVDMNSSISTLSTVNEGLSLTSSIAQVTATALTNINTLLNSMRNDLITAQEPGVDFGKIQSSISASQQQIQTVIDSASFNGVNWLKPNNLYNVQITGETDITPTANEIDTVASKDSWNSIYSGASTASVNKTDTRTFNITKTDPAGNVSTEVDAATSSETVTGNPQSAFYPNGIYSSYTYQKVSGGLLPDYQLVPASTDLSLNSRININTDQFQLETTNPSTYSQSVNDVFTDQSGIDISPSADFMAPEEFPGEIGLFQMNNLHLSTDVSNTPTGKYIWYETVLNQSLIGANTSDASVFQRAVESAITQITSMTTNLGSIQNQLGIQTDFNNSLSIALKSGVGSLVDADMNEASIRLAALQTQQQIGIQSLNIANDNAKLILQLFSRSQ